MFSYTPLYGGILGMILGIFLLGGNIWFDKMGKPKENYSCPLIIALQQIFLPAFLFYGLILWDITIKTGFLGILSYGNIRYNLAPIILCGVLGTIIIFGVIFNAPTIKSLVISGIIVGLYVYLLWINPNITFAQGEVRYYIPLEYVLAISFVGEVVWRLIRLIARKPVFKEKPLWDITAKFKRIVNTKTYIIIWALFCAEVILEFTGVSLLSWI